MAVGGARNRVPPMLHLDIQRNDVEETAIAAAIVVGGLVVAWLLSKLSTRIVHVATRATETDLDDEIARQMRLPVVVLLVVQAIYIALRTLSYLDKHQDTLERIWAAASLFVVVLVAWRVVTATFTWYQRREVTRDSPYAQQTLPILRRIVNVTIILVGGVIVLDQLGIAISPLLAGLGIGGLAVALAAQPILANIFAGSYVLSDGSIRVGDFIELEGGPSGWVDDIGWRATRIRTFDNNFVVIPNSTLADATVTNFDAETPPVGAPVMCGIAYEEDLDRVEAIVIEELAKIVQEVPGADPTYEPLVRFQGFGDSNIDFLMKLRGKDHLAIYLLKHEMIKRIHARFAAEGITINYPARRLFLEEDDTPGLERLQRAGSSNGGGGA